MSYTTAKTLVPIAVIAQLMAASSAFAWTGMNGVDIGPPPFTLTGIPLPAGYTVYGNASGFAVVAAPLGDIVLSSSGVWTVNSINGRYPTATAFLPPSTFAKAGPNWDITSLNALTSPVYSAVSLASGVANNIPYQTASGVTAFITPVNSAVVVTSSGGVPSESTTLPDGINLGTPSSVILTNASGSASALTAGFATNIAGGSAGNDTYQTGAGATSFMAGNTNCVKYWVTATGAPTCSSNPQLLTNYGIPPASGRYYFPPTATSTVNMFGSASGSVGYTAILTFIPTKITPLNLAFSITTAAGSGTGGFSAEMCVYATSGSLPGALLIDGGPMTLAVSGGGVTSIGAQIQSSASWTIGSGISIGPGWYWVSLETSYLASGIPAFVSSNFGSSNTLTAIMGQTLTQGSISSSTISVGVQEGGKTFGACTSAWAGNSYVTNSNLPLVAIGL